MGVGNGHCPPVTYIYSRAAFLLEYIKTLTIGDLNSTVLQLAVFIGK
jgi:hypothetical protein